MSWLSSGLKKVNKTLKPLRGVGKVVGGALDVGSDFLPPGLSFLGNTTAKLMQNKNLKSSVIGAGKDMAMGKIGGMVAGKLAGNASSKAAKAAQSRMGSIDDFAARTIGNGATDNVGNVLKGAGQMGFGGKVANAIAPKLGAAAVSGAASALAGDGGGGGMPSGGGDSYDPNATGSRISTATRTGSGGGWQDLLKNPGLLEAGANLGGSVISGYAQGAMADKDRAWDKEKFGRQQIVPEGDAAMGAERSIESAPMRDKAMYLLTQRMGMQPESFTPHDIFNPSYGSGPAKLGGFDDEELNRQNAAYTPGAGGVKTDIQKMLLQKLGYAPKPATVGR